MKHSIDGRSIADGKMRTEKSENEERPSGRPDGTKRLCGYSSLINEDGQTQLHLLCQNSSCSTEEVNDLIIAVPSALSKRDVYGRSVSRITLGKAKFVTFHACVSYLSLIVSFQPLFYALKRGCSIEVIQLLFDGFPDAILFKDFCGDIPLYLLYHPSKDSHILQYVLKKMPSLAVYKEHSFSGQPLVSRMCAPWTSKEFLPTKHDINNNAALKDQWTKLVLTVRAAHTHALAAREEVHVDCSSENSRELQVALEYSCPPLVLRHFAEMYPEQACIPMKGSGCFPLHYFLGSCELVRDSKVAVQSLIKAYPLAVYELHNGCLPLHLAIAKGMTWTHGIQDLVYTGPENLDRPEPLTGMVPFVQAAVGKWSELSTVYSLLRENPAAL